MSVQIKIAKLLKEIGTLECLKKATSLEENATQVSSLHLRSLKLNSANCIEISKILTEEKNNNNGLIRSISFSYNSFIGDFGAIAITKSLPASISEIGMVACGIGDVGGVELLKWIKDRAQVQMVCIEQNNFSETLKKAFKAYQKENPNIRLYL